MITIITAMVVILMGENLIPKCKLDCRQVIKKTLCRGSFFIASVYLTCPNFEKLVTKDSLYYQNA